MIQVDVEKFLQELEILVNMDSGQGNPDGITAVGKWLADRLVAKGWIAEQVDVGAATGRCTVVKNREADHYDVMLVGHVDTVFPTGETAKRPFRRDETRAYGLGVIDMKQGDLAIVHVLEQLPDDVNEKLNILVIFNPDEEIGSRYSKKLIDEYAKISDYAYIFEAASTDGSHTIQRKGMCSATVEFHGQAGHAGYLFNGGMISAINELIYWGSQINTLLSAERETSVNIGVIEGGVKTNVVPDYAKMMFEARYDYPEELDKVKAMLEQLKEHAAQAGVGVEINFRSSAAMMPTEKTHAYIKRVTAMAAANGIDFYTKKRGGLSDANHISACGPICVDGLGPTGDCDHSDKEYLEISTIEPNLKLVYLMLCDLAKMKDE
jgi:glutamate carboxypeptidase